MLLNGTVQDDKSNFNKWNIYVSSDLNVKQNVQKKTQPEGLPWWLTGKVDPNAGDQSLIQEDPT